jgi:hypothetical protein
MNSETDRIRELKCISTKGSKVIPITDRGDL